MLNYSYFPAEAKRNVTLSSTTQYRTLSVRSERCVFTLGSLPTGCPTINKYYKEIKMLWNDKKIVLQLTYYGPAGHVPCARAGASRRARAGAPAAAGRWPRGGRNCSSEDSVVKHSVSHSRRSLATTTTLLLNIPILLLLSCVCVLF